MTGQRFGALELMQAMQLGHAVAALHALGVMDALTPAREPEELARQFGLDAALLAGLLDHAARATDLVRRDGRRYRSTRAWNREARFLVTLYGLAFGAASANAQTLLKRPESARRYLDRERHAQAFDAGSGEAPGVLPALLKELELRRVLDLGCGRANLLIDLARSDPGFQGWGVESGAAMRKAARRAIREAGAGRQVRLLAGDARFPDAMVPPAVADEVQAVVASQFVNEMFGSGPAMVVRWLRDLRGLLPRRLLVVADYYGRLGSALSGGGRLTLVHDHAQLLSGQGVPPARRCDWAALYAEAGGRLIHALEDRGSTLFIHLVAL